MVKRGRHPRIFTVTTRAIRRKLLRRVIRLRRLGVIVCVTTRTGVRRVRVVAVVATRTVHRGVCPL